MPRPGVDIRIVDDAPRGGAVLDTSQAFMIGQSERGPTDRALAVLNLTDYATKFGARSGGSLLYDSVAAYFAEGGQALWVSRICDAAAVIASGAFGSLTARAASPGTWGNTVKVSAVAPSTQAELLRAQQIGGTPIVVTTTIGTTVQERSPVVGTADDLVAWKSAVVTFTKGADNLIPAVGVNVTLAGGTNGSGVVDATTSAAALARFGMALGPGQVLAPGLTTTPVKQALLDHGAANLRCSLLELPDSNDPTVLVSSLSGLQGTKQLGIRLAAAFGPWALYPSQTIGAANVTIPYTGLQAGLIARCDQGGNPNEPAAGARGASRFALGLSQSFTDDQRNGLNGAGINMAKMVYGAVETYGYRTAAGADDTNWLWFGNSRTIMAIGHEANAVGEDYVLRQIDGKRRIFAKLEADLAGICLRHFNNGALYGETPEEAFSVDTGPSVNTTATIAAGEIHALIRLKCSPAGEWVSIEIVKVPVERALAA